jgi:1-acyl-sn-glycerol-3-phosphate acyltransferase
MIFLRSLLFNLVFFVSSAILLTAALPALLMPRRVTIDIGILWVRFLLAALRIICGIRHEVRGRENLPDGPCIVAAKHQSAWDTLAFSLFIDDGCYVVKQELTRIPVYGWLLSKTGVVAIDRAGGARTLRAMVKAARVYLGEGRRIVIFPEGTRTKPGDRRPYHPGIAALYQQLAVPVVPVALNSGLFWQRRAFVKRPGLIVVEFLPPIQPGLTRRDFMARLETEIEQASDRLCAPRDAPRDAAAPPAAACG